MHVEHAPRCAWRRWCEGRRAAGQAGENSVFERQAPGWGDRGARKGSPAVVRWGYARRRRSSLGYPAMQWKAGRRMPPSRIPCPRCQTTKLPANQHRAAFISVASTQIWAPRQSASPVATLSKIGPSAASRAYEKQEGIFSSIVIPQWPFLVISIFCSLYAASHILLSIIHCKAA
jgi:hypothetical protein